MSVRDIEVERYRVEAHPVFCTVKTRPEAEEVVEQLRLAGFAAADVSMISPDAPSDVVHERRSKAPEGAVTGAGTGGLVGGALGWLVGVGALTIPGLGVFVAAGPIMGALSGAAVGAAVGGIGGSLVGLGVPEVEAKRYEERLREGQILIAVHTYDRRERARARDVFRLTEAEVVPYTEETE
jgi:hypothetical protein